MFARSNYLSRVDPDTCVVCGTCEERCPVDGISLEDTAVLDADKCIGCGVCYPSCTTESITLVARPEEDQKLVLPMMELVTKLMGDKQRQFKFRGNRQRGRRGLPPAPLHCADRASRP